MNNLHTTTLRAARFWVSVILLITGFSLSAQPPGGSSTVIVYEDIIFLQSIPTSPTEAENNTWVADNSAELATNVSLVNNKNLVSDKPVQNNLSVQSANAWETSQNQATERWQAETLSVTAYPNPVIDYLQIELADFDDELQLVELFGANGQLLKRQNTPASSQVQIDMSSLANGSYFVRTTTLKGATTLPVSKY